MSDTCDIRINMNTLEEAIKEYTNCKNTLENLLTDLESGVKDVESTSWKGEAKDAFVNIQFPDFKEGMQKHCDMIAELIKELKETSVEFNTLDTDLKTQMAK